MTDEELHELDLAEQEARAAIQDIPWWRVRQRREQREIADALLNQWLDAILETLRGGGMTYPHDHDTDGTVMIEEDEVKPNVTVRYMIETCSKCGVETRRTKE